jgi:GNAT superfamily N-acetyltransferase
VTVTVGLLGPGEVERADELARVVNAAYGLGERELWLGHVQRTSSVAMAEAIETGEMLVATSEGRLVGCGRVHQRDDATGEVGLVSADPDHWGAGVGREIVRAAEEVMRARGVETMQLELLVPRDGVHPEKERLRAWYERRGYRVVGSRPFAEPDTDRASRLATPCDFLLFRKSLAG